MLPETILAYGDRKSLIISETYECLFFDERAQKFFYHDARSRSSQRFELGRVRLTGAELSCVLSSGKRTLPLKLEHASRSAHPSFKLRWEDMWIGPQGESGYVDIVSSESAAQLFAEVSTEDLGCIISFLAKHWFSYETGKFLRAQLAASGNFGIKLGSREYHLADIIGAKQIEKDLFLRRGYFVDRLFEYRPLIYYVAFGSGALSAMSVSLDSLCRLAGYRGDICVITDRSDVKDFVPQLFSGQVHILSKSATSKDQFSRLRYEINDFTEISRYSPILYLDVDVVVERPLEEMFARVILSGKVCAAVERYPTFLESRYQHTRSVGSRFFDEDNYRPIEEFGFNSGVISFKTQSVAELSFKLISEIMIFMEDNNLDLDWLDQAIANYVLQKCGAADVRSISPFVAAGESFKIHLHSGDLDTDHNAIVHFFATVDRVYYMKQFIEDRLMRNKGARESFFSYLR